MPLAKRIIPCLDMTEGRVVKGIKFVDIKDAGDPPTFAAEYDKQGADELVFLDITASSDKRDILVDVVKRTAEQVFIPFSVGGGIRTIKDIRQILTAGADKISMNTAAVKNPQVVKEGAEIFGSQCIIIAVDAKRVLVTEENYPEDKIVINTPEGNFWWEVYIYGGRTGTSIDALKWIKQVEELGAGEILLTSMDRDGTKDGYDNYLNKAVTDRIKIPLIASGGCGTLEHVYDAFKVGNASAALAASIFHYNEYTCQEVKNYLRKRNILVRN
ncbi:MAG: imidazole glycerol phosphate synthase subunit HisF [Candidatus Lokiarchaeota archaeon]|nr:imidazole glycerol phosphate synthase subunit HisF [Candidatus Lokiarchaeota archaeon]